MTGVASVVTPRLSVPVRSVGIPAVAHGCAALHRLYLAFGAQPGGDHGDTHLVAHFVVNDVAPTNTVASAETNSAGYQ